MLTLGIQKRISAGYGVTSALNEGDALEALKGETFDLSIVDLQLAHQDGISLMEEFHLILPEMPVIILTAYGSIESAVEAMKRGAYSYVTKPFDPRDLLLQIERALEDRKLTSEIERLKGLLEERYDFANIVARSEKMQRVLEVVSRIAKNVASIAPFPTVTVFIIPATSTSLSVPFTTFTATDNVPITGYLVTESATAPTALAAGWSATSPVSYSFATTGTKNLYAWAIDAAGIVSSSLSASVTISAASQNGGITIWEGQWFKLTSKITGSCSGASGMVTDSASDVGYLKLWKWDPDNKTLQSDLYEHDTTTGQWCSQSISLLFMGGSDLDFLCQSQVTDNAANSTEGFTARIVGKETAGVLKSATFKSLGGYYIDSLDQSGAIANCAGGLKLTDALIATSKVPVPIEVILH